jgi:hypothetical protein
MDEDQVSYDAILRIVDNGLEDTKKIVYDTLSNACANNDLHERREVRYMVLQGLLSDDWSKNEVRSLVSPFSSKLTFCLVHSPLYRANLRYDA